MIPIDEGAPREPAKANPYLIPVHAGTAGRVYNPYRLVDAVLELKHAAYAICAAVFRAGYAYPRQDIVEQHAHVNSTDDGVEVSFPPPAPGPGDTILVLDHYYGCAEVPYDEVIAGNTIYFDLDTGQWVTFTVHPGHPHLVKTYESLAAKYPLPEEETSA